MQFNILLEHIEQLQRMINCCCLIQLYKPIELPAMINHHSDKMKIDFLSLHATALKHFAVCCNEPILSPVTFLVHDISRLGWSDLCHVHMQLAANDLDGIFIFHRGHSNGM